MFAVALINHYEIKGNLFTSPPRIKKQPNQISQCIRKPLPYPQFFPLSLSLDRSTQKRGKEEMEMAIDTPLPSPEPSAAAGRQTRAAEAARLEYQLVRVPLVALRSNVRVNHHLAEKEITAVLSSASSTPTESSAAAVDHLTSLVSRLHGLKRKALPPILPLSPPRVAESCSARKRSQLFGSSVPCLWIQDSTEEKIVSC
jgi:hypothetical protein